MPPSDEEIEMRPGWPPSTEAEIQAGVLRAIGSRSDVRLWRANAGVGRTVDGSRVIRFGLPGQGDLCGLLITGRMLQIEVKRPGGRLSDRQARFGGMIRAFGGVYLVVHSVEEAVAGVEKALR